MRDSNSLTVSALRDLPEEPQTGQRALAESPGSFAGSTERLAMI